VEAKIERTFLFPKRTSPSRAFAIFVEEIIRNPVQRHTGPIFHLIEDLFGQSIVEVHSGHRRDIDFAGAGRRAHGQARHHRARGATHLQARDRQDRPGRDQHPSGSALSSFDDDATREGLTCVNLIVPTNDRFAPEAVVP
jgi:hypothetical protein